jgi:hypothetical protein
MANPCLEGRNRPMDTDPGVLGSFPTIENAIRKSYYNPHLLEENEQKQIWTYQTGMKVMLMCKDMVGLSPKYEGNAK